MADAPARILERDPDLGAGLDGRALKEARAALVAPTIMLARGSWEPSRRELDAPGGFGVLMLEGLLSRDVLIAGSTSAELIGSGDLLRPWEDIGALASMPSRVEWTVLEPTELAVLDMHFVQSAARWPEIVTTLVLRSISRAHSLAVSLAISSMSGLERRCLVLLWHLADRFGRMRSDGVSLSLPLTHQLIARLVGATRPSVSTALKTLERQGLLERGEDGGYVLHGDRPEELLTLEDRQATRRSLPHR